MDLKEGNIIAINKPKGISSHDVVNKIRHLTGIKRVGHGGTLDPLAEGVLVIAIGRSATKQLDKYIQGTKEYIATIMLGKTSTTDDEEGEKTQVSDREPSKKEIEKVLLEFKGTITQTPPIYSALKIGGKPAYKYARRGQDVEIKPRRITIESIRLITYHYPLITIKVTCHKGVYIRSLARDIGKALETGGYLSSLKRTRVADFTLKNTRYLNKLNKTISS